MINNLVWHQILYFSSPVEAWHKWLHLTHNLSLSLSTWIILKCGIEKLKCHCHSEFESEMLDSRCSRTPDAVTVRSCFNALTNLFCRTSKSAGGAPLRCKFPTAWVKNIVESADTRIRNPMVAPVPILKYSQSESHWFKSDYLSLIVPKLQQRLQSYSIES